MTMNLITGKAGAPHITSSDQGAMQAGLVGNGNYLLQGGDGKFPAVTMQSANKALVPVLNLVIEGRYARVTAAETVTIESGVTGRNRNDLICVKYTRDSNNIETIALAVLKGTATSGTAADPTVPSGSILNNSGTVWIPIARIPISGITAGTPVMLVKQLPPMSQLWDSVTLERQIWHGPYGMTVHLAKVGMMAFAFGNTSFTSDINSNGLIVNETMAAGFLPEGEGAILLEGVNEQHGALSFDSDGKVTISGSMNSGYYFRVCGCWPVK
ncbi:hypothetical protein PL984_00310 [Bifidobacterium adolescentis]|uniref:hypothetical protein n=1 Tax=Bifidobacterium adolescentis TaxID=1680 RepID=UPI001896DE59|nr:hypothetical protein [Bifidobacterium adolescentis]MDB1555776.1 hypothetical protein [Bifidobacterium adolescentis]